MHTVLMSQCVQNYYRLFTGCVSVLALTSTMALSPPASAELFDGPVAQLPVKERVALQQGQVLVTGSKGSYVGKFLVSAPVATAWKVVTDYNNFERFVPNVLSSQLLQSNGNRKVFEQIQVVRVFAFTKQSRVRLAVTEVYPQRVGFRVIQARGLDSLEGVWRLEPVSPYRGAKPNQVLLTHQVTVKPRSKGSRDLFFGIYKDTLEDTLAAIRREIERRS